MFVSACNWVKNQGIIKDYLCAVPVVGSVSAYSLFQSEESISPALVISSIAQTLVFSTLCVAVKAAPGLIKRIKYSQEPVAPPLAAIPVEASVNEILAPADIYNKIYKDPCYLMFSNAIEAGDIAAVKSLLNQGLHTKLCVEQLKGLWLQGVLEKRIEILKLFGESFFDKFYTQNLFDFFDQSDGDVESIKILIQRGFDVNFPLASLRPLESAFVRGYLPLVQLLLENGADMNNEENGPSVWHWAVHKKNIQAVYLLITHGANIENMGRINPDGMKWYNETYLPEVEKMRKLNELEITGLQSAMNINEPALMDILNEFHFEP